MLGGLIAQQVQAANQDVTLRATHYGPGYNGSPMGCPPYNAYSSNDTTIVAVGGYYSNAWPCGTRLELQGPAGTIVGTRQDTCPGCGNTLIDLSEAGITAVCGGLGGCTVTVRRLSND